MSTAASLKLIDSQVVRSRGNFPIAGNVARDPIQFIGSPEIIWTILVRPNGQQETRDACSSLNSPNSRG
jgi:hypothetical protein